jgi:hypothetical protein
MPVLMMTEVPGADATLAEGMRQAGVLEALAAAPGFRGHWSGAADSGYRVAEVWESQADCEAFFERHMVSNFPPGLEPPRLAFFALTLEVTPASNIG